MNPYITIRGKKVVAVTDVVDVDTYQTSAILGLTITPRSTTRPRQYLAGSKRKATTDRPMAQKCPRSRATQQTPHDDDDSSSSSEESSSMSDVDDEEVSVSNNPEADALITNLLDPTQPLSADPIEETSPHQPGQEPISRDL